MEHSLDNGHRLKTRLRKQKGGFMPAIVGAINVISVTSGAVMHIGDVFTIAPKSTAKTFAGAGSFITGEANTITNYYSSTNTYESDAIDQPMLLNL